MRSKASPCFFSLANKCAKAAEGRAWHSTPQDGAPQAGGSGATIQGGGKKKKNKNRGCQGPQASASIAAAAIGGQNACDKCPRPQGGDSGSCPVHPYVRHSAADYREI